MRRSGIFLDDESFHDRRKPWEHLEDWLDERLDRLEDRLHDRLYRPLTDEEREIWNRSGIREETIRLCRERRPLDREHKLVMDIMIDNGYTSLSDYEKFYDSKGLPRRRWLPSAPNAPLS